ncbi:MAG: hypothetical protein GY820_28105 [Gammaproteobacteria bacterium]|nr:hypothetical protein [Gammaproteobacteria bacterium]
MAIYSKEELEIRREERLEGAIEASWFTISNHLIIAIYKSPKAEAQLQILLDLLSNILHRQSKREKVVIVGDFNVDLLKCDQRDSMKLVKWMEENGFQNEPIGPTTDHATVIDQIWANCPLGQPTQTMDCYYSDHKKILATLP